MDVKTLQPPVVVLNPFGVPERILSIEDDTVRVEQRRQRDNGTWRLAVRELEPFEFNDYRLPEDLEAAEALLAQWGGQQ
jgi:hypothetical protein